jgi:hypothetical protein
MVCEPVNFALHYTSATGVAGHGHCPNIKIVKKTMKDSDTVFSTYLSTGMRKAALRDQTDLSSL